MDIAPKKKAILEFLFPLSSEGRFKYDQKTHYMRIEEQYLLSSSLLDSITREDICTCERNSIGFHIYTNEDNAKILCDAKWLLKYIRSGNKLSGYFFELSRLFASKQLRKRIYILNYIYFDGKPCNNEERLLLLVTHYRILNILKSVNNIWNIPKMPTGISLLEKFYFLKQLNTCAKEAIQEYNKEKSVIDHLLSENPHKMG